MQGVSLGSVKIGMIGRTGVQPFSPMPVEGSVGSVGICIHSVGSVGGQSGHVSPPPPGVSPGVPGTVGVLPIGGGSSILSHCSWYNITKVDGWSASHGPLGGGLELLFGED